jgi:hypothetical protein
MRGGRWLFAVSCVLAALLVGCGDESSPPATTTTAAAEAPAPETTPRAPLDPERFEANERLEREIRLAPNPWKEPTQASLEPHPDAKVSRVIVRDVKRGTGRRVRTGDSIVFDFIESNYTTGRMFQRAWGKEPWPTTETPVVPEAMMRGMLIGLQGMQPGGRRQIIVPRHLSDIEDTDRAGYSFYEIVYFDLVLRGFRATA